MAGLRFIIILNFVLKRVFHQILQHWLRLKHLSQRLSHKMKQINSQIREGQQLIMLNRCRSKRCNLLTDIMSKILLIIDVAIDDNFCDLEMEDFLLDLRVY